MVEDAQAIRHGANGTDLSDLFRRSKSLVENARSYVGTLINAVTVYTSFELGRYIVEEEQGGYERAGYGKHVIDALSEYLTAEFGRGFSRANVAKMRQFYLEYRDRQASIVSTGLRRLTTLDAEGIVSTPSRQFVGQPQTMPFRLCKRSDQALVELTLPKDAHIYAAEYRLYLPSKELLQSKLTEWLESEEACGQDGLVLVRVPSRQEPGRGQLLEAERRALQGPARGRPLPL